MNYEETFKKALDLKLDIYKLTVANEVFDNIKYTQKAKRIDFEFLCEYIGRLWLKFDTSVALASVVNGVIKEIENGDLTVDMINDSKDRCEDYDIIEVISQCYC